MKNRVWFQEGDELPNGFVEDAGWYVYALGQWIRDPIQLNTDEKLVEILLDFLEWMDGRGLAITETRDYLSYEVTEYLACNGWPITEQLP